MATPWWLESRSVNVSGDNGGGNWEQQNYDRRTGQIVYQKDGKWYSSLPQEVSYSTGEDGQWQLNPASAGVLVDNTPPKTANFLSGQRAPYANLGGEVGMVDGRPAYLFPMDRGATVAGDLGMYGGAQRASWRSPSGAQGTVVQGPDGAMWVAAPSDAIFGEANTADHSTMIGNAIKDFGPIVAAALPFSGLGGMVSSALGGGALGAAGAGAALGGVNALVTGGDPLKSALKGGIAGGVGSALGSAMSSTGLPQPVQNFATSVGTNLLSGQPVSQALVSGGINALNRSGIPANTSPAAPAASTLTGGTMADDMYGGFGYSDAIAPTDMYGGFGYADDNAAIDAALGGGIGGAENLASAAGATGGMGVPSWLSKFFGTPGVAGALVSGAGGLLAANMTGSAAERAAALSAAAGDRATALQAGIYADQQAKQQPFYQAGVNALAKYQDPALTRPFGMSDFNADPGYGFRVSEGLKALDRQAAQRGGLISGGALKAAANYGQNAASQEYQNAYNRYVQDQSTQRNTLANIAGFGPPAAAATGSAGTNYATNTGNIGMNTANTNANAGLASTAAQASAYGGIANSLGKALSPDPLTDAITAMMRKQYGVG